jgi:A/G-specific adenine glycosylase
LPVFESEASLNEVFSLPRQLDVSVLPSFKHVLTHKDLHCHVVKVKLAQKPNTPQPGAWWSEKNWTALGLPTPIRHLLSNSL